MLMAEITALGETAHVENAPAILGVQPCTGAADDRRCRPLGLLAPAMQNSLLFWIHEGPGRAAMMCCGATSEMIALATGIIGPVARFFLWAMESWAAEQE